MATSPPCAWHGVVDDFLRVDECDWATQLCNHHQTCALEPAGDSQRRAWHHCFCILRDQLPGLVDGYIIFEYELPRERGRRPDVVILKGGAVLVLEFKGCQTARRAHIDQVAAYARDLLHYHAGSRDAAVIPILVLTESKEPRTVVDDVMVVCPDDLGMVIRKYVTNGQIAPEAWLASDYAPLPTLVAAARTIFRHEPLPQIRRAQSAGIPEAIAELIQIADEAQLKGERHLALVTGVPGAGKTLVGLQFVYSNHFEQDSKRAAVFLSGNGPLVKVLQHALKSSVFVQDVHGFLKTYGGSAQRQPEEHIWVYDEAQRAWDAERVRGKRGHGASEPEDFLRLGCRTDRWAMIVGLIGEGQEIHLGEEAGLGQWNDAIASAGGRWIVHCPSKLGQLFTAATTVVARDELDLTTSLRSHLAVDVQTWVRQLLDGNLADAAKTAASVRRAGFDMYVTRDLDAAKAYVRERYVSEGDKRFGLLASSKAKNLEQYGVPNGYNFTKNLKEGPWYTDPSDSKYSCCQLHDVVTEFACQGLELDFPIVAWGSDLTWDSLRWMSSPQPRSRAHNPHRLRVNSYRVLLSRGRDGFAVFVPDEFQMENSYMALCEAGLKPI